MVIDRTHAKWMWGSLALTAAGALAYVPYAITSHSGADGGSAMGLIYGFAAAALMLAVGLLGLRRVFPGLRLGRMQTWMRAHLWLGLLAVPLVLFHGGFSMGSGLLTHVLMVLALAVTASGLAGVALQHYLPRLITSQVPLETIYEQIGHVRELLRQEAEQVLEEAEKTKLDPLEFILAASARSGGGSVTLAAPPPSPAAMLRDFYANNLYPFLNDPNDRSLALANDETARRTFQALRTLAPAKLKEAVDAIEGICEEHRQLMQQERLHRWLHGWLLVHVPLSYALLALTLVHGFTALRY